jgi:putative endonuclease
MCHPERSEGSAFIVMYYVYVLASRSRNLYIGVTGDLDRRIFEHKNKLVRGFTSQYNIHRLVYYEVYGNVTSAIAREKELKGWRREKKIALVERENPTWDDLSEGGPDEQQILRCAQDDTSPKSGNRADGP